MCEDAPRRDYPALPERGLASAMAQPPKFENAGRHLRRAHRGLSGHRELFGTKKNGQLGVDDVRRVRASEWTRFRGGLASPRRRGGRPRRASSRTTASSGRSPPTRASASARPSCRCTRRSSTRTGSSSPRTATRRSLIVANDRIVEKTQGVPRQRADARSTSSASSDGANGAGRTATASRRTRRSSRPGKAGARSRSTPTPRTPPASSTRAARPGNPKGVILSHGNIASNVSAVHEHLPDRRRRPLASRSCPGRTPSATPCELHALFSTGASHRPLRGGRQDHRQPRRGEAHAALQRAAHLQQDLRRGAEADRRASRRSCRTLFKAALKAREQAARRRDARLRRAARPRRSPTSVVFSKVRARFGGRLKYAFSGGAAISRDVAEFIDGLGITVYEGYGLTETSPIATANWPGDRKIGSVGQAIPGVKIDHRPRPARRRSKDGARGEILVYGPNVMLGYHNRDEENDAVFTERTAASAPATWAYLDDDGFLYITGRIKEQYKLENGKYVVPDAARGAAQALALHHQRDGLRRQQALQRRARRRERRAP